MRMNGYGKTYHLKNIFLNAYTHIIIIKCRYTVLLYILMTRKDILYTAHVQCVRVCDEYAHTSARTIT